MKKIMYLLSIGAASVLLISKVSAEPSDFKSNFFRDDKLSVPENPCSVIFSSSDNEGNPADTEIKSYCIVPAEIQKIKTELASSGYEEFIYNHNAFINYIGIQTDIKFDNGPWLSSSGNWDKLDYGRYDNPSDSLFNCHSEYQIEESDPVLATNLCWLGEYDPESNEDEFFSQYITETEDEYGFSYKIFDLKNHTIKLRSRYFITYYFTDDTIDYDTPFDGNIIFSEWTSEYSLNSEQKYLQKPSIQSPVISDFSFIEYDTKCFIAQYNLKVPESVFSGMKYYASENITNPYNIEVQFKIDDNEWEDANSPDYSNIYNGYKYAECTTDADSEKLISLRARFYGWDGEHSEWSDTITSAAISPEEYASEEHDYYAGAVSPDQISSGYFNSINKNVQNNNDISEDITDISLTDIDPEDCTEPDNSVITVSSEAEKTSQNKEDNTKETNASKTTVTAAIIIFILIITVLMIWGKTKYSKVKK